MPEVVAHSGLLKKTKVHVEDTGGPGRPVVLIHGWPMSSESWSHQIGPLRDAGFRVVAYDRRGFGRSDKPSKGYDYDTLADDLEGVMRELDLHDATLVGFSMGGGEVARYVTRHGEDRLRSVVFACAVTPFMHKTGNNPQGVMTTEEEAEMAAQLSYDRNAFFDGFTRNFFSVDGSLVISERQRQDAIAMCQQSDQKAALECMTAFGTTDFREDLRNITVPALVIHGDSDAIVPIEKSGKLTDDALAHSSFVVIEDAPHGFNVSHAEEFNQNLIDFLGK